MKTTNAQIINRKSGMTLLELTVVILVLLSLIAILFVGARAWKKGSDRSSNILNIRNTQQAMRGEMNMRNISELDITSGNTAKNLTFGQTDLEAFLKFPSPIATITYTPGTAFTTYATPPVTSMAHIWLGVSPDGEPGSAAGLGHQSYDEIADW